MHPFLESLAADHRQILALLAAFEAELGRFAKVQSADFDVLEYGIAYCVEYLDRVHHRREEQALDRLREIDPAAAVPMVNLSRQHHQLEEICRNVGGAFGAARDGMLQGRDTLWDAGLLLLERYRHHLAWEEAIFFPTLRRALSHTDFDTLAAGSAADPPDPLAGDAARSMAPAALLAAMEEFAAAYRGD